MTEQIELMIEPKGKARPRFAGRHAYTPKSTRDYEKLIRIAYERERLTKFQGPVSVTLTFNRGVPESWSKAKQHSAFCGRIAWMTKPDVDNLCKAVLDALNGVAWHDDKQVVQLIATKRYSVHHSVSIEIKDMEAQQ